MSNIIFTGNCGRTTINRIIEQMSIKDVVKITRRKYNSSGYERFYINDKPCCGDVCCFLRETDTIINYGCAFNLYNSATIINSVSAVNKICDKFNARMAMDKFKIPRPKTSLYHNNLNYPMILRPRHHSRGKDFYLVNNGTECYAAYEYFYNKGMDFYYSEFYNKKREVRVHVAHGKILLIHEKGLSPDSIQANHFITGEEWKVIPWSDYEFDVCRIAVDAVKSVGADFGAVDIMINRDNTEMPVCVCEINSAPSFETSEYTVSRYAKYFDWIFSEPNRKWWDYEKYTQGKSFAWKNNQLDRTEEI